MNRTIGLMLILASALLAAAAGYLTGFNQGHSKGYVLGHTDARSTVEAELRVSYEQGQTDARSVVEAEIQTSYERGYESGFNSAIVNPPAHVAQRDIEINGRSGSGFFSTSYHIYLSSNPTDFNGYYSVWRYVYDPSDYYFMDTDFDTIDEIKEKCSLVTRSVIGSNSLIYTDGSVNTNLDYIYCVTQDDGDYSRPIQFK